MEILGRISKCIKQGQNEYKTRDNWTGKVIFWEQCKWLKFDYANKWYMHKPGSVLENESHIILSNLKMQMDLIIQAWMSEVVLINKKKNKMLFLNFDVPANLRGKIKKIEKRQILRSCHKVEETVERESDSDTNSSWCPRNHFKRLKAKVLRNRKSEEGPRL